MFNESKQRRTHALERDTDRLRMRMVKRGLRVRLKSSLSD